MIKRGFVDEYGNINDFDTVFGQIAESMGLIQTTCSILLAIAVANEDCLDNALLTFEHC